MAQQELAAWLAIHRIPGIGGQTYHQLLTHFGDPATILAAGSSAWRAAGLKTKVIAGLKNPPWEAVEGDLQWLEGDRCHLITYGSPHYPKLLAAIDAPPALLFLHGDPEVLTIPQLAIVGSRNPSRQGEHNAHEFGEYLASNGLSITSGLAQGIDSASHKGALTGGGITIAVMGTGIDRIFPAQNRDLAHRIAEEGALVSELPPGTQAKAGNFPRRNRIISGLSLGTLVVEAAVQSGSLITARLAIEQGREVFAIPGSIHNPLAKGCHQLLRQGAKLVETATDILEELPLTGLSRMIERSQTPAATEPPVESELSADPDYVKLLECLGFEPIAVDELVELSGLAPEAISSMLLMLELNGEVSAEPGGRYCRICHPTTKRAT